MQFCKVLGALGNTEMHPVRNAVLNSVLCSLLLVPAMVFADSMQLAPVAGVVDEVGAKESAGTDVSVESQAVAGSVKKSADPWEKFNRSVFSFNDRADRYVFKPLAKGYVAITPKFVRTGITNLFLNLRSPVVILNDMLQGKIKQAGSDTARFVTNSTVGIVGLFDVAVRLNMPLHDEDFGQTLGKWGVRSGPYLVLPFMGPSTVRDTVGWGVDIVSNPRRYLLEPEVDWSLVGLELLSTRASLLDLEDIVQGDRYLFIRDLYLQRREFSVKDGQVEDSFMDDADADANADAAAEPDTDPNVGSQQDAAPADEPAQDASPAPDDADSIVAPPADSKSPVDAMPLGAMPLQSMPQNTQPQGGIDESETPLQSI